MASEGLGTVEIVRDRVGKAARGAGDIARATAESLGETFAEHPELREPVAAESADAIYHVAGGAIQAASRVRARLGQVARGTMIGVLRVTRSRGIDALAIIGQTAEAVMRHTVAVGGDRLGVARGLLEGAIQTAPDIGLDADEAASAAARGALKTAGPSASAPARELRRALAASIVGARAARRERSRTTGSGL